MNHLTNFKETPPNGWKYFEPSIGWKPDDPMLPLDMVAKQLSVARYNNPAAGLDPSLDSCLKAIGDFTCKRAEGKSWFGRFCTNDEKLAAQTFENARPRKSCAGCGGKKR